MTDEWDFSDNSDMKDETNLSQSLSRQSQDNESNIKTTRISPRGKWLSETDGESVQQDSINFKKNDSFPKTEPSTCIGVFGLSKRTDENALREAFEKYGTVKSVNLIMDKFQNVSVGYAFINYENLEFASLAVKEANGINLDDKTIRVDFSITKKAYTPTPGGYKGKIRHQDYKNNIQNRSMKRSYQGRYRSNSPGKGHIGPKNFYRKERDDSVNNSKYQQNHFRSARLPERDGFSNRNKFKPRSPNEYRSIENSPVRKVARRHSPILIDQKKNISDRYSPYRSNNLYNHTKNDRTENRRHSPYWLENARSSEQYNRRNSPYKSDYRKHSPLENRMYSSNQSMKRNYSPDRYGSRKYPRDSEIRSSPQISGLRRMSPSDARCSKRIDNERFPFMKYHDRKLSPHSISRYSPDRCHVKRHSLNRFDNEKRLDISGIRKIPSDERNFRRTNDFRKFSNSSNRRENMSERKYTKDNDFGMQNYQSGSYYDLPARSRKY